MAATSARPLSQVLPDQFDESLSYRKRVRSHYRPFSTLYTAPPYLGFKVEEEEKPPTSRFLKRASSITGFQALQTMAFGITFKPKKDSPSTPQLGTPDAPKPSKAKPKPDATRRPSTANGTLRPPQSPFSPRLKTKRSMNAIMISPDPTASSASLGTVTPPSRPVLGFPPRPEEPPRPSTANGKAIKFKERQQDEDPSSTKTFKPMLHWQERHNMKFHPYGEDAVYMQAYDTVLLESDRFSDQLLQRLSHGSPSFYDYGKKPPATVLDLGCGEGHWVLHAASVWKESLITGFDLVDITLPAFETTDNVHFVQGNFVKYRLPFEDKSFEFVRMANLTLCIPYLQWVAVLAEARRVLTVNGRLEIIDDQMMFPYAEPKPMPKEGTISQQESKRLSSDSGDDFSEDDLDSDTLEGEESGSGESSTLYDTSRPSSFEDRPLEDSQLSASETIRPLHTQQFRAPRYYARPSKPVITDPHFIQQADVIWERKRERCQELETLFLSMLRDPEEHHEVALKPHEFMTSFLGYVFGNDNAREKGSFSINLAEWNSPLAASEETEEDVETKEPALAHLVDPSFSGKKWINKFDWEKRKLKRKGGLDGMGLSEMERAELTLESPIPAVVQPKAAKQLGLPAYAYSPSSSPDTKGTAPLKNRKDKTPSPPLLFAPTPQRIMLSAKAAGIFGVSFTELTAATAQATVGQRRGLKPLGMVQSPGLLIQSTEGPEYLRMDPVELEMHACKWMHTLLGCRQALGQYVTKFMDEKGRRWVNDEMFGYYLSEYEGFGRLRFGWPAGAGEKDETELLIDVPQQSPAQPWNTAQSQPDKPLRVRSVRVYHAVKADDTPVRETPLLRVAASYA